MEIKIAQGNVNVICTLIEEISGSVQSPKGELVSVKITTAKGNSSWFTKIEGAGQVIVRKFASESEMAAMVASQVKFFVKG